MSVHSPIPAHTSPLWKSICAGALAFALAGQAQAADGCGYRVASGTYATWPGGYQAWVEIDNQSGETATSFEVLLDTGGTAITDGSLAKYQPAEGGGYLANEPNWLQWQQIPPGASYRFHFNGEPDYAGMTPYLISINGKPCDREPPEISLSSSARYFTAAGTLTLTAEATDNTAVRKVVFARDGEVIAEDWDTPYQLELAIDGTDNGRHVYTATAYDPGGNKAVSKRSRLLVAVGDRFFGTAPDGEPDYPRLADYFDQLTPGNAGKWASVEGSRDQMNWQNLDAAYQFARERGLRFKLHTLIWGQQQPGWIGDLPPEEQLAEIDQWMAAVAERYPDLEMIDVVNEPLHAQPAYKAALGGDGETGWDWLINAFALARAHFPDAELILNDYNILILGQFTNDYLAVIERLQSRGLIDGIGLQAHFLERAELPVVQSNLDALAATGLPIYISELELNFADDARQANAMRDLFSIFWEHPAVVGVTHWGYLENRMWRENGYLLRADGTERPALQWLTCYLAGGDCDHLVPEYIPAGWRGGEYGLTLEAELYDEGQGLIASGNQVAFTDDGDWIAFRDVEFQQGWDTFQVHYAKGNETVGSISIHLDDLASDPVLTLPLEPTGGWGSSSTLEVPWAPLAGTRDVYIRFNDTWGVANVDWLRIGKPEPVPDTNLVTDGGFEGTALAAGWSAWWTGGTGLALTGEQAAEGTQSLRVHNRTGNSNPSYDLSGLLENGSSYAVSAQVRHTGPADTRVSLTAKLACSGGDSYIGLADNSVVAADTWTQLSGTLEVPADCSPGEARIYFENTPLEVETLYIDEVSIIPL